jgi:hypothetical protein
VRLIFKTATVDGTLKADSAESVAYLPGEGAGIAGETGKVVIGEQEDNAAGAELAAASDFTSKHAQPGEDPAGGPLGSPPALEPVSGMYVQETAGNKTVFGEADDSWEEDGTEWTWPLKLDGEELTAYFAVVKSASQTVTVGSGGDADKVTVVTDEETDGTMPGETKVVVKVDMEDVVFDGTDENGKGTRTFPLVVSEDDRAPVTVTVNLELTLPEDVSIYHRKNFGGDAGPDGYGKWTRVAEPTLTASDISSNFNGGTGNKRKTGASTLTAGKVTDLQNAFAWFIIKAESGTGEGTEEGTTKGYSEYRVFIKRNEKIGKVYLIPKTAEYVSLELYGAGIPSTAQKNMERHITLNHAWRTDDTSGTTVLFYRNGENTINNSGIITFSIPGNSRWVTLVLGKNITLDGRKDVGTGGASVFEKYTVTSGNGTIEQSLSFWRLLYVGTNKNVIMRPHSKITGYSTNKSGYSPVYVVGSSGSSRARFYMQGGEVSGNEQAFPDTFSNCGVISMGNGYSDFIYTGGTMTGNTGREGVPWNVVTDVNHSIIKNFDD